MNSLNFTNEYFFTNRKYIIKINKGNNSKKYHKIIASEYPSRNLRVNKMKCKTIKSGKNIFEAEIFFTLELTFLILISNITELITCTDGTNATKDRISSNSNSGPIPKCTLI